MKRRGSSKIEPRRRKNMKGKKKSAEVNSRRTRDTSERSEVLRCL